MNIALLRTLQARPDSYFWPESVARSLMISPARLLRDLHELEEFGFGIEHVPNRGIRFTEPARRLCVDQIEWELGTQLIGRRISVWKRTTSTNDIAARAGKSRSNEGLVVLAEEQTAGRGRRHRRWHAPPQSSILMSVLIFPPKAIRSIAMLTSLAAVAVADVVIESLNLPARIKWPNDVRVEGEKFCGILVEDLARGRGRPGREQSDETPSMKRTAAVPKARPDTWRATVIGIGINVNIEPHEFPRDLASPATSLMALCGRCLDRSELARSVIRRLDHYYQIARTGSAAVIWRRWRDVADLVGQTVRVEGPRGELRGRLVDLWPQRGISLQVASGELVQLTAEEVLSVAELDPNESSKFKGPMIRPSVAPQN